MYHAKNCGLFHRNWQRFRCRFDSSISFHSSLNHLVSSPKQFSSANYFRKVRQGGNLQGRKDNFYVAWVFALELKLSKSLSGLVYFVPYLKGGRSPPPITAIQNTQAHSEFLTTSIPKQKPRLHKKTFRFFRAYPYP